MIQEPIICRAVNTFAARLEPFAARTAAVFKRAVFFLAAYIDNNQVSLKAKEKLLKNRRAFNTTVLVLVTILVCYIPTYVWVITFISLREEISSNVGHIVFSLTASLLVLNSLLNPLIYTVRIRIFRVAFIQMLARKTFEQAEEIEQRIFDPIKLELKILMP